MCSLKAFTGFPVLLLPGQLLMHLIKMHKPVPPNFICQDVQLIYLLSPLSYQMHLIVHPVAVYENLGEAVN